MTASQKLAQFAAGLTAESIPADVRTAAGLHVLDTFGCGLAAFALGEAEFIQRTVEQSHAPGACTAIGFPAGTLAAEEAAMVNGVRYHALDYDDTHPDAVTHVSSAVVAAAFAAAEEVSVSGPEVVAAIVAGNEVSIRIGAAAAGQFHARGFHPTGMVGIFGATAAAARARRLDAVTTAHAFGLAGSMAGGLLEFLSDGAQTKPLHPGWAARAAVTAVRMAANGATGPTTVFEGPRGFYATYLHGGQVNFEEQLADLGDRWETPRIAYKPYAACHFTHAPVDALAQLMETEPLDPDEVVEIVALSEPTGVGLVLEPAADKVRPRTPYDSKFSLPYCLAHQLVRKELGISSFVADEIADPDVLAVASRVSYETKKYSATPDSFGGGVRVTLRDGRVLEKELRHQRGSQVNPMTEADIIAKYRDNASLTLDEDDVALVQNFATHLTDAETLAPFRALASAHRAAGVREPAMSVAQ